MKSFIVFCIQFVFIFSFCSNADALLISVKKANVRSGPGTDNKSIFVYKTNAPFKILGENGSWIKVEDFEEEVGWVSKSVVDTNKRGAIVRVANANIRRGPGFDHPVIFLAGYGVAFEVLKSENGWLQVKHEDGDIGWIQEDLVFSPLLKAFSSNDENKPPSTN